MKTRFLLICLSVFLAVMPRSQAQDDPASLVPAPVRTPEELAQLFGPIALYPDALIALILPASTVPSDVVLAARYLRSNGDPTRVDGEQWDDSVKSLSHYPSVVKWMDENLAWTKQVGEAFVAQPADVMNAIQRLRAEARAAGTLQDTPQQTVVMEDDNIAIVPSDPDVIYVPSYDPDIVYISRPGYYHDPYITFGLGFSTGIWLGYDFDWGRRRLWTVDRRDRERFWRDRRENEWRNHQWHGSPRVESGPSHPRVVEGNQFRQRDWHPRPDAHRPLHPAAGVVRTDSNRPDNSPRRYPDQRTDARRNDNAHNNDDHRGQRGPQGANNDHGRPNPPGNANAPSAVNGGSQTGPQAPRPAAAPSPAASPQPAQNTPRTDSDHHNRNEREARGNDRPATPQNPQGRVMQLQPQVQPRPAPTTPTVVNREARAPQSPPQASRQYTAPQVQARPQQQTTVRSEPRVQQAPAPSRQESSNNNSNNDRNNRDDRRGPRS